MIYASGPTTIINHQIYFYNPIWLFFNVYIYVFRTWNCAFKYTRKF